MTILLLYAATPTRGIIETIIVTPLGINAAVGYEGLTSLVTTSWIWQNYGYFIAASLGGIFVGFMAWFVHGHIYDRVEHAFAARAARHSPQFTTTRTPLPVSDVKASTPVGATTRPPVTTQKESQPEPQVVEKQETTKEPEA